MTHHLLQDAFPELAAELRTLLGIAGQAELASQIASLQIIDRCRCGDDFCATFYTILKPKGARGVGHETIPLDCEDGHLNVDVVDGGIVSVEVLYRDSVRDKLLQLLP